MVYGNEALGFKKVYGGPERACTVDGLTAGCDYGFTVHAMNEQALALPTVALLTLNGSTHHGSTHYGSAFCGGTCHGTNL